MEDCEEGGEPVVETEMKNDVGRYFANLYQYIPVEVLEGLLAVLCFGALLLFAFYGWKRGWRMVAGLLLVEYLFFTCCSTIYYREVLETRKCEWTPFWSYETIVSDGDKVLLAENLMNVAVFVPVGVLLGCAFRSMTWWKVLLLGGCISVIIEVMQFCFKRGLAETDDVMHNTLGCLIGYGVYKLARNGYERIG